MAVATVRSKIVDERRLLASTWFGEADDFERILLLNEILARCTPVQVRHLRRWLQGPAPISIASLPRRALMTVFSYLDPASLSRACQVCWLWNMAATDDTLWQPRCVRRGWLLPYAPSRCERGAWKAHYIDCVQSLKQSCGIKPAQPAAPPPRVASQSSRDATKTSTRRGVLYLSTALPAPVIHAPVAGALPESAGERGHDSLDPTLW